MLIKYVHRFIRSLRNVFPQDIVASERLHRNTPFE